MINGYVNTPNELATLLNNRIPGITANIPGIWDKMVELIELKKPIIIPYSLVTIDDGQLGASSHIGSINYAFSQDPDSSFISLVSTIGNTSFVLNITRDDNVVSDAV